MSDQAIYTKCDRFVVVTIDSPIKAAIAAVYRPPQYNVGDFLTNLKSMLDYLDLAHNHPVIICGEFNEDPLHTGKKNYSGVVSIQRIHATDHDSDE